MHLTPTCVIIAVIYTHGGVKMIFYANAKINLYLDVVGIREDGFHNIKSVMHSISLCDKLTIEAVLSDKTEIEIVHDSLELSNDMDNLIYKYVTVC